MFTCVISFAVLKQFLFNLIRFANEITILGKAARCSNMQMIPSAGDFLRHREIMKGTGKNSWKAGRRQEPEWPET